MAGLIPDTDHHRALVADLLRGLAEAPFDEGFTLRFVFVDEGGIVPVEVAFIAASAEGFEHLMELVVGDAAVRFVRNGLQGLKLLSLDRLDAEGVPSEVGTLWASLRVAGPRGTPSSMAVLARAWSPLLSTVVAAQATLEELVTGDFITPLFPAPPA
jgi:hypothetical protein